MLTERTNVEIHCDGPDCTVGYSWFNDDVAKDADKLPDPVYRFLILAEFMGGKWLFCGKFCLLQWLKKYEPPKSPREIKEVEQEAKLVQEAKDREAQKLEEMAENEGMLSKL